jgi:hypothetical protein
MYLPSNVKQVPGIKSASIEGFTFQDDSSAIANALIYCTGRLTNSELGNMHIHIGKERYFSKQDGNIFVSFRLQM